VTSRSVMDSPSEPDAAPRDALGASLVAAHKATLRRPRRDGGDNAGKTGAVNEPSEQPDVSAEADTDCALADNGAGDLEAIEAVSVAAAVAAAQHVLVNEEVGAGRLASEEASGDDGPVAGDKEYADELFGLQRGQYRQGQRLHESLPCQWVDSEGERRGGLGRGRHGNQDQGRGWPVEPLPW